MAVCSKISRALLSDDLRLDSDFYRPEYLRQAKLIARKSPRAISTLADVSDGNHLSIAEQFTSKGVRYLRGQDLSDFFLGDANPVYIPEELYKTLERSHIFSGDVLVVVVGANTGTVALVTDGHDKLTANCKIAIVRPHGIEPEVLAIYLSSRVGHNELRRRIRGSGQTGLILPDLRDIPVPKFSSGVATRVVDLVQKARLSYAKATALYPEARQELLDRMRWKTIGDSPAALTYVASFADVAEAKRYDANFFQPRYTALLNLLSEAGCRPLASVAGDPKKGVSPVYSAEHDDFFIVNSKNLGPQHVHWDELDHTTAEFYTSPDNQAARLKYMDVLVYSTGAYVGRSNVWLENRQAVAGVDVTIVRPDSSVCNPVYLSLFLNSPPGILLSETASIGSAQRHIYPAQIARYPIYLPKIGNRIDIKWQEKLAKKVIEAYGARTESQRLVASATELIEQEIVGQSAAA